MSCPLQNVSISPDQIRSNDAVRDDETTAFYDRLAACWNACQGIPTASLQSGIGYVQMLDGFRHSTPQHSPTFSAAAERNAACVRACHGISTEALNAGAIKAAVDATIYKDVSSVIPHPYANEIRFSRNADGTAEITVHPR